MEEARRQRRPELSLEVVDVPRVWRFEREFVHYQQEVVEAADGWQGWGVWASQCASSSGEEEGCSDPFEGNGAALKVCGQASVLTAGRVASSR